MNDLVLPSRAPVRLEALGDLALPTYLLGSAGTNREANAPCQITAQDDLAAIRTWLDEFDDSPETFRSYRKEVERFYNWVLWTCNKPLSSVTRNDLLDYEHFMASPFPAELWCGKRNRRRNTSDWRPFEGPLQPKSRALAMTIIGALFSYLVDVRYLSGNPCAARRRKKRDVKKGKEPQKHIPRPTLQKMIEMLEHEADSTPIEHFRMRARFERMLFVVRFMVNTGVRRDEMANLQMSDVFSMYNHESDTYYWYLRVLGKGDKSREVALNNSARDALNRYRHFYNASDNYRGNHSPMLLPLANKSSESQTEAMSDQMVYNIVKEALAVAAAELQATSPEDAGILQCATPHWFRHTFATLCLQQGADIKLVQEQLGHESIDTTAIYQHAVKFQMYETFNSLRI